MEENALASVWTKLKDTFVARLAQGYLSAAANGGSFGTLSPAEQAEVPPSVLDKFVSGTVHGLATLPKRAFESSEAMRGGYGYDAGPLLEAAMLPMGTGAIAGVPMRAGEAVLGSGLLRHAPDPTQTGWVFKDVAQPPMAKGDWRKVTAATETGEGIQNVELPVRSMYATQKGVNPDFASPLSTNTEAPFVIKKDGRYFVQDGHHRITAASEAGKETVPVRMVDIDKTTQTDFPLLDLIDFIKKYGIAGLGVLPLFSNNKDQGT